MIEVRNFAVKPGESFRVPLAGYLSNHTSCFTLYGFDKPEFIGLFLNEMPHFIELNLFYFIGYFRAI